MIGQTIDARPPVSKGAVILMVIAVALVAWAVAGANPHPALAAILPLCLALARWLSEPPHALVMVEHDGLTPLGSPNKTYYSSIHAVAVGGVRHRGDAEQLPVLPIEIHHDAGCLILPAKMNVAAVELLRYLLSRVPLAAMKPVHPTLAKYYAEQQQKFGPEKVHLIHTRELLPQPWRRRRDRWVVAAIFLTGLLWLFGGATIGTLTNKDPYVAWIVFGCLAIMGSFLTYLQLRYGKRSQSEAMLTKHPDACLVIGPAGLAMVQGDIQGAMRWDEITKVTLRTAQSFRMSGGPGLLLSVRGGEIHVLDIYDRTSAEIERLVRGNLHGPADGLPLAR